MFNVRIRQVMVEGGETCAIDGCEVAQGEDLVVLEVNGKQLLEMSGPCAAVVGDTLMAEARHVALRRQRRRMNQLTRLQEEIGKLQRQYDEAAITGMGGVCQLSFAEHFVYRKWMAVAQVHGLISLELANWLSDKLGREYRENSNGGWPAEVSDAEKALVTALFGWLSHVLSQRRLL